MNFILGISTANVRETFSVASLEPKKIVMRRKSHTGTLWTCARSKIGFQMGKSLFFYKVNFLLGISTANVRETFFVASVERKIICQAEK